VSYINITVLCRPRQDEPTNYLDRDSLGALAAAIREFGGGVVMISHNSEFTTSLCGETWLVDNGQLSASGEAWAAGAAKVAAPGALAPDEVVDAFGNVIKVQKKVKMTRREIMKRMKVSTTPSMRVHLPF
jgi:elongation factor 3